MGDFSVATPPQPPGSPYGAPNPYGQQPGPYDQSNPYGQQPPQPNPYGNPVPQQGGYGYPQAPQPPQPQPGGYGYPQDQQPPQYQVPPQPSYGQQPYGQQPYGQPGMEQGGGTCRFCGGYPATDAMVRSLKGRWFFYRYTRLPGPYCRTCGTAAVRDMSAQSLAQGWWGYGSLFMVPIYLFMNLAAFNKIKALPEPAPYPPGPPMDPGKPLLQRPQAAGFLVPIAFLLVLILAVAVSLAGNSGPVYPTPGPYVTDSPTSLPTDTPTDTPTDLPTDTSMPTDLPTDGGGIDGNLAIEGQCVKNYGTNSSPDLKIVDCGSGSGVYVVEKKLYGTTDTSGCPSDATTTYTHTETDNNFVMCLKPSS
ncbi:LppU/SCO3897 family protein [Streptacidiphilus jiangxiensis]|nr:hypothetical protein [Streptacidiphilus jiangxiensis]